MLYRLKRPIAVNFLKYADHWSDQKRVKTIWMQEFGTGITKFITLYPDRGATP
jgi:hypothetical protein